MTGAPDGPRAAGPNVWPGPPVTSRAVGPLPAVANTWPPARPATPTTTGRTAPHAPVRAMATAPAPAPAPARTSTLSTGDVVWIVLALIALIVLVAALLSWDPPMVYQHVIPALQPRAG